MDLLKQTVVSTIVFTLFSKAPIILEAWNSKHYDNTLRNCYPCSTLVQMKHPVEMVQPQFADIIELDDII